MERGNSSTAPVVDLKLVRAEPDTGLSAVARTRRERDWQLSDICTAQVEPALRAALHFHHGGTGLTPPHVAPNREDLAGVTAVAERAVMEVSPVVRTRAEWEGRHEFKRRLEQALWTTYKHDEDHREHLLVHQALERLVTTLLRDPDLVALPAYQSALVLPGGAK